MQAFEILLPLALILCLSKLMGLGAHRIGMPAVIGMLLAGILIGLLEYIPWEPLQNLLFADEMVFILSVMSKIGVVLIMFSAGLTTDLKQLRQTGAASVVITTLGVLVPMLFGWLVSSLFFGFENVLSNLFYGAILTATSVSVTVAVLKELGKLDGKVGTSIIAAAVIDDVLGIVILSVLTGFASGGEEAGWDWFHPNAGMTTVKIVAFFIVAIAVGVGLRKLFNIMERRAPHNRRVPILSLAACFVYAYTAESSSALPTSRVRTSRASCWAAPLRRRPMSNPRWTRWDTSSSPPSSLPTSALRTSNISAVSRPPSSRSGSCMWRRRSSASSSAAGWAQNSAASPSAIPCAWGSA